MKIKSIPLILLCFFHTLPVRATAKSQVFLFMGDQGHISPDTTELARHMLASCNKIGGCTYGLSAGDNIYHEGVKYHPETEWELKFLDHFVNIYRPVWNRYRTPFFMALGNHDVGITTAFNKDVEYFWRFGKKLDAEHFKKNRIDKMESQVRFTKSPHNPAHEGSRMWNMDAYYYSKLLTSNGIKTFLVVLNTNTYPGSLLESGDGTPFNSNQELWLREELASEKAVTADWRIVLSHHPLYSIGRHGANRYMDLEKVKAATSDVRAMEELRDKLGPILCDYNVNLFLTGHDHHLEVDMIPCPDETGVLQVLSGAASKKTVGKFYEHIPFAANAFTKRAMPEHFIWANGLDREDLDNGEPARAIYGFSLLQLSRNSLRLEMITKGDGGPRWMQCWNMERKEKVFTRDELLSREIKCSDQEPAATLKNSAKSKKWLATKTLFRATDAYSWARKANRLYFKSDENMDFNSPDLAKGAESAAAVFSLMEAVSDFNKNRTGEKTFYFEAALYLADLARYTLPVVVGQVLDTVSVVYRAYHYLPVFADLSGSYFNSIIYNPLAEMRTFFDDSELVRAPEEHNYENSTFIRCEFFSGEQKSVLSKWLKGVPGTEVSGTALNKNGYLLAKGRWLKYQRLQTRKKHSWERLRDDYLYSYAFVTTAPLLSIQNLCLNSLSEEEARQWEKSGVDLKNPSDFLKHMTALAGNFSYMSYPVYSAVKIRKGDGQSVWTLPGLELCTFSGHKIIKGLASKERCPEKYN